MERQATRASRSKRTVVKVGETRFGRDPFPVIAGPCAVESEDQINTVAEVVADSGASILRAATYRQGNSPYFFRGLRLEGAKLLAEAGKRVDLPVAMAIMEERELEEAGDLVDLLEIHHGSMQNFELLRVAGRSQKPVMLRRGSSATLDEFLWAVEYLMAEGNDQVILVERGIRTFGAGHRDTLDITAVPQLKETSHLPVLVDPSHASGGAERVPPLALAAQGVGSDGLIVEVHPEPAKAKTEGPRQLNLVEFAELMVQLGISRLRSRIDLVDREIVRLLARRRGLSLEIGRAKAERGWPVQSSRREAELLEVVREEAILNELDPDQMEELFSAVLEESRQAQQEMRRDG
ncbi:MAG: 3-deoxy-7-phosphoheptulonate synthase [Actinomycetia bacterium]|nr:3-deoxy-7-phosphoheptulonate synthase [Actinomycetes bacterium]